MPLNTKEDFAKGDEGANFCQYCVNEDGDVKPCDDIFEGGVQFFMNQVGSDRVLAEKITRKNMLCQEYWKGKDDEILKGDVATDEEFAEALKKLS